MPLTNAEKQARARAKRSAKIERYEAALRRLASMEAFTISRAVRTGDDDELIARIEFADRALG